MYGYRLQLTKSITPSYLPVSDAFDSSASRNRGWPHSHGALISKLFEIREMSIEINGGSGRIQCPLFYSSDCC